jgi:hypothetical protein
MQLNSNISHGFADQFRETVGLVVGVSSLESIQFLQIIQNSKNRGVCLHIHFVSEAIV